MSKKKLTFDEKDQILYSIYIILDKIDIIDLLK
jgi:hypothetical protein